MGSSSDEILLNYFRALTQYTRREEALIGIVCGIKDDDIVEFTDYIKDKKDNEDEHSLLQKFIDFCNIKKYDLNDEEEN